MSNEALEVIDAQVENLTVRRKPDVVLEEARQAASALQKVIAGKPKKVMFNNEQYLEFEDWQTIARFYGLTSEVESTSFVDYGGVKGFSARAVVKRADGVQISAAESECLNDESNWQSKPLFQLKSMAQTRAQAKALRNVLSWVVVLAGYKATPAEELIGTESVSTSAAKSAGSAEAKVQPSADGSTTVKAVKLKPEGTKKPGWVVFADGRELSTFDDKVLEQATALVGKDALVIPKIKKTTKGDKTYENLDGLELVVRKDAPLDFGEDTEPVGEPEKVLMNPQEGQMPGGSHFWRVQTDRRQYVTDREGYAIVLRDIKNADKRAVITFERKKTATGTYCVITEVKEVEKAA